MDSKKNFRVRKEYLVSRKCAHKWGLSEVFSASDWSHLGYTHPPSMNNMESSYIEDRKGGMDESEDSSEADEEESKRLEERRKEWRVDDRRCSATSSSSSSSSGKVAMILQVVTLFFAHLFFNE